MTWRGQFRVRGQNGAPNKAWITDGDNGDWVTEAEYRLASRFSPPWDDLPWR